MTAAANAGVVRAGEAVALIGMVLACYPPPVVGGIAQAASLAYQLGAVAVVVLLAAPLAVTLRSRPAPWRARSRPRDAPLSSERFHP